MIELILLALIGALALLPTVFFAVNFFLYRRLPVEGAVTRNSLPAVSVLIPARNEEAGIRDCVASILANRNINLEVIVLDDASTDRTAEIVRDMAEKDSRVRLAQAPPLPTGWCGKQHACHVLGQLAQHDAIVFMDADVRLSCDALTRMAGELSRNPAKLISGIPRQVTVGLLERLLIPLIHTVLLCYLPIWAMRKSSNPSYGAGCGQLFMAERQAYLAIGGHEPIRATLHDGIMLPRLFRKHSYQTDLFDATDIASCRMYHSASAVWQGLAKNATEGMASSRGIGIWSILLLGGHVLPVLCALAILLNLLDPAPAAWLLPIFFLPMLIRLIAAYRYRQSLFGAILHPLGVTLLVAVQWYALIRHHLGFRSQWKGRQYVTA